MPDSSRPSPKAIRDPTLAQRRAPVQQRSRERLSRILGAAEALIGAQGSDRLKMAELAELAGISIGSLYQYFPDRSAVLHALAARYNAETRRCIVEALTPVSDMDGLRRAFSALMAEFHQLVRNGPVMRDIWAGMQADKGLAALQLDESRAMGRVLADAVARARPVADRDALAVTTFLLWDLGEATVRLAIAADEPTGARMIEAYTRMALRELASE